MKQEQIMRMEEAIAAEYKNMVGMVIVNDGENVYENYYNGCTAESRIHVFSVTKSVVSILIGIAIDKGLIKSIDDRVLDYYHDYTIKRGEKTLPDIRIKDILTMTVPYKYKFNPYTKYFTSKDWVKFSLDKMGGKGKIGEFRYAPIIGPDVLSGILVKATGQSVLEFAKENLFGPLDIKIEKSITFHSKEEQMEFYKSTDMNGWVADPQGVNTAGWGLTISPVDMAKIGQLFLNKGKWNGKQIVSEKWVEESTAEHSRWKKMNLPYGYLWWIGENSGYAAMGDGGNIIYVNPDKNLVVAITSLFYPRAKDRIEFIEKYILPYND
ncbi:CubicO group peptidase, beta-lactamase class C family [Eubacterium ruminantium]|nr:CubicO group peptidase, beta-lactamase class C family [Eubacterium ruminantium]